MRRFALTALACCAVSCGPGRPTEVVLVVDSDLLVPDELDTVEISIGGSTLAPSVVTADLTDTATPQLPLTVTIYPLGSEDTAVFVTVVGRSGSSRVVERRVRTGFVSGESRMLRVLLARRCVDVICGDAETCDETGCRPVNMGADQLPEWPGSAPILDGPACAPQPEVCNGFDDDCDDMVDEDFDLATDAANCGQCGRACGSTACVAGLCDGEQIRQLSAGGAHTCGVRESGQVVCWGWNLAGQLGDGTTQDRLTPVTVLGLSDVEEVAAGAAHTCARTTAGEVSCWGDNAHGELGDGTRLPSMAPVPVTGPTDAVALAAGVTHSCAVTGGGTVLCWGDNTFGQLGNGDTMTPAGPVPVMGIAAAVGVAVGQAHSCAVLDSGGVACWGDNTQGQLGDATMMAHATAAPVVSVMEAVAVAAGLRHTCALRITGTVACWGDGVRGQLGSGMAMSTTPLDVPSVTLATSMSSASAGSHTCVAASGALTCWGANASAQIGSGVASESAGPTTVTITGAIAAAVGGQGPGGLGHSCALLDSGAVSCWGANGLGQLGTGTTTDATEPTPVRWFD